MHGCPKHLLPQLTVRNLYDHALEVLYIYCFHTLVAVIKYWGKGDVKLNTPMNSSASITLDQVLQSISFEKCKISRLNEELSNLKYNHIE